MSAVAGLALLEKVRELLVLVGDRRHSEASVRDMLTDFQTSICVLTFWEVLHLTRKVVELGSAFGRISAPWFPNRKLYDDLGEVLQTLRLHVGSKGMHQDSEKLDLPVGLFDDWQKSRRAFIESVSLTLTLNCDWLA
jgi:hypothetical protein